MNLAAMKRGLIRRFQRGILTVDSHTGGEQTRFILDGVGPIPGKTMTEKLFNLKDEKDWLRLSLCREPKGHPGLLAALLTEPTSSDGDFGLIFMDARRYPYLCGHAAIGAVTTLIESGGLPARGPQTWLRIDTPSGQMKATAFVDNGRVESVAIEMVPSFVLQTGQPLRMPGLGEIRVDLVCVGGFFVMVSAGQLGLELSPKNSKQIAELGMNVINEANMQLSVYHPERPEVETVDVVSFHNDPAPDQGQNVVVYGESHLDRSPCGTGTTAKMTLLHHQGVLELNEPYINAGPLGTTFEGRLIREVSVGDYPGVVAEILGSAHITGIHQFISESEDPFPEGFLL